MSPKSLLARPQLALISEPFETHFPVHLLQVTPDLLPLIRLLLEHLTRSLLASRINPKQPTPEPLIRPRPNMPLPTLSRARDQARRLQQHQRGRQDLLHHAAQAAHDVRVHASRVGVDEADALIRRVRGKMVERQARHADCVVGGRAEGVAALLAQREVSGVDVAFVAGAQDGDDAGQRRLGC